jgi:RNA polymerase sigma factor (sigma-70 family)
MAATALDRRPRRPAVMRPALGADDDRLVRLVRDGDDSAFEAIYDRYAAGLLAFCDHMLANRDDAEDALQHSLSAAYRMLRAGDRQIALRPWLYTVARNRCLSVLRARRGDISLNAASDRGGVADEIVDQVQRRSDLRDLVQDLRLLPGDQRAALVLFELGGLPHDEIATVLQVRREKVKALVFQAREGLIRARSARDTPCTEMRRQLATLSGGIPSRSVLRRHVDRCPSCALFEAEVGRQRAGLALILPVLPAVGLKATVLGSTVGRWSAGAGGGASAGGGAALLGSAGGGGGAACAAGSGAAGLAGSGVVGSGSVVAGAAGGGVSGALATAGGAGTVAAALGAKSATVVAAKLLTAVAVAVGGGAAATGEIGHPTPDVRSVAAVQQPFFSVAAPPPAGQQLLAPAAPVSAAAAPVSALGSGAHDPLQATAASQPLKPAEGSQPTPSPAPGTPVAPPSGALPSTGATDPGASPAPVPATAIDGPPATAPPTTATAPPATTSTPATTIGVTTTVSAPVADPAGAGTTTTSAAPASPAGGAATPAAGDPAAPAAGTGTPATGATGASGTSGPTSAGSPAPSNPAPMGAAPPAGAAAPDGTP